MFSRSYGVRNTWLNNCLQRRISEDPLTVIMVTGPKHFCNMKVPPLPYFSISVKVTELEEFSHTDMENLKTVC